MRRPAAILALALMLAPMLRAQAFNPERVDILRLQLGMTEAQVNAILLRQGIATSRIRRSQPPCPDAGSCVVTLVAPAQDGELTIVLTPAAGADPRVHQITYVITNHAINQTEAVTDSVLGRFGPPDQADPMTWCRAPAINRVCAEADTWLRFWPASRTISLRAAEPDAGAPP